MPGDRKEFERAHAHWQELMARRQFSVAPDVGKTAILSSHAMVSAESLGQEEVQQFDTEAYDIAEGLSAEGYEVDVIIDAKGDDFKDVLKDRTTSDIIVIGHGALPYIYMQNGLRKDQSGYQTEYSDRFDWRDVAAAADHLKTGLFIQRTCGHYVRKLSVPLGLFAVNDPSRVIAAVNNHFTPKNLSDPQNERLYPALSPDFPLSYGLIKRVFDNDLHVKSRMVEDSDS